MKKQPAKSKTVRAKKADETKLHPFFESIFSAYEAPEEFTQGQFFVALQLEEILDKSECAECKAATIYGLYESIRHNPELKKEAAAMKAFYDAQNVLNEFVLAKP